MGRTGRRPRISSATCRGPCLFCTCAGAACTDPACTCKGVAVCATPSAAGVCRADVGCGTRADDGKVVSIWARCSHAGTMQGPRSEVGRSVLKVCPSDRRGAGLRLVNGGSSAGTKAPRLGTHQKKKASVQVTNTTPGSHESCRNHGLALQNSQSFATPASNAGLHSASTAQPISAATRYAPLCCICGELKELDGCSSGVCALYAVPAATCSRALRHIAAVARTLSNRTGTAPMCLSMGSSLRFGPCCQARDMLRQSARAVHALYQLVRVPVLVTTASPQPSRYATLHAYRTAYPAGSSRTPPVKMSPACVHSVSSHARETPRCEHAPQSFEGEPVLRHCTALSSSLLACAIAGKKAHAEPLPPPLPQDTSLQCATRRCVCHRSRATVRSLRTTALHKSGPASLAVSRRQSPRSPRSRQARP